MKNVGEGATVLTKQGLGAVDNATSRVLQDRIQKQINETLARNPELANQMASQVDDMLTGRYNIERKPEIVNAISNGVDGNMNGFLLTQRMYDDANTTRSAEGKSPYTSRQTTLYGERTGAFDPDHPPAGHYMKHADQLGGANGVVEAMLQTIDSKNASAYPAKNANTMLANTAVGEDQVPVSMILDENGGVRSISERTKNQIQKYAQSKSALLEGNTGSGTKSTIVASPESDVAGFPISGPRVTNDNVSQNQQNVNPSPVENPNTVETGKQIRAKRNTVKEIINQFDAVDKPTARATKPNETFYNLYDKMGLSDGDQIRQAVSYAEPGNLVPNIIREAAGKAGVVDALRLLWGRPPFGYRHSLRGRLDISIGPPVFIISFYALSGII